MDSYPSDRGRLFALHYSKWLFRSGAANEVGPDATALILAVVMREDDMWYSRPPNFYNSQLMDRCGIASEHALNRARKRAVDGGLLSYTPGKKRTPGKYFVLGFSAQDAENLQGNVELPCAKRSESEEKARPSTPNPIPKKDSPDKKSRRAPKFSEADRATADWMYQAILEQNPEHRVPDFDSWANTIRLMREQDKRTNADIREVWTNVRRDDFWSPNVLCPEKLRKQWDQLVAKKLGPKREAAFKINPVIKAKKETASVA